MTKDQRLTALKARLDELLPGPEKLEAKILLWQFIQVFKARKRYDATGSIAKKAWYIALFGPMLVSGYIRDVRVNSTVGKMLFGDFAKFGTLTATLKRVKEARPITGPGHREELRNGVFPIDYYLHQKYGPIRVEMYELAVQVCAA